MEAHETLLFSSVSEVRTFDESNSATIFSLIVAIIALLLCLALIPISLIYSFKHWRHFNSERVFFFMEFFAGLKDSKWARFYTPALLIRRLFFVIIIILLGFVGRNFVLGLMLVFQLIYTIALALVRPFEDMEQNIVELVNEGFFFLLICIFLGLEGEEKWNDSATKGYIALMTVNNLLVLLVVISKYLLLTHKIAFFVINLVKFISTKCGKKKDYLHTMVRIF